MIAIRNQLDPGFPVRGPFRCALILMVSGGLWQGCGGPNGDEGKSAHGYESSSDLLAVVGERCFSVQHHPEAGPGPHDSRYLFEQFDELMADGKVGA